jgi:hypothetical protein
MEWIVDFPATEILGRRIGLAKRGHPKVDKSVSQNCATESAFGVGVLLVNFRAKYSGSHSFVGGVRDHDEAASLDLEVVYEAPWGLSEEPDQSDALPPFGPQFSGSVTLGGAIRMPKAAS